MRKKMFSSNYKSQYRFERRAQLIRYSRARGFYQDFFDRGLLLTRKLLNQGFPLKKLRSSVRKFTVATMTWLTVTEYLCHKWPRYVPLVVNISRSFPHSWLINGFVTRYTRRVSPVERELPTLSEHPCSTPVFSGVRVSRSIVLYIIVCPFVLFFWPLCCLFFNIRILITSLVSSNSS